MKLLKVDFIEDAVEKSSNYIKSNWELNTEKISLESSLGRILSQDIISQETVPSFNRSMVDGYAVISSDVNGCTESIPSILTLTEKIEMGRFPKKPIISGQCAYVPTGGMLPQGCDSVVMIEYTEEFSEDEIAFYSPTVYRENVVLRGEDISESEKVLSKGTILTSRNIALLAGIGVSEVEVFSPFNVSIFSTGDELIDTSHPFEEGKIRDINGYGISAMAKELGMNVLRHKILKDDEEFLKKTLREASVDSHMIILSGGSSQGKKDFTNQVIDSMGDPGVFTHGLAIKPGKPTILGGADGVWYVGLPGHPVSAMIVFEVIVGSVIKNLRCQKESPYLYAELGSNIASSAGKQTYILCSISEECGRYKANPIYAKSGLIKSLSMADGYIVVDKNCEGLKAGDMVKIKPLR